MAAKYLSILIASLCLIAVGVCADEAPLSYAIETLSEDCAGCALIGMDDDGSVRVLQGGASRRLSGLIELRREGQPLPPLPVRNFALFTNGDRLPLDPQAAVALDENRLFVWPASSLPEANAKGLSLYVPNLVLLFWTLPEGVEDAELFIAKLQEESRKRDVVYLSNGDRIEGTVTGLGAKVGCVITVGARKVQTPWSKLAGIAWNTQRQARVRAKKIYYHAVLDGGARINFAELRFEEKSKRWVGKTQLGPALELPASAILAIDTRMGQAVDLADLTPKYEHHPYLDVRWPLMKDAAVTGRPLRLAGSSFDRGIGLHAPCEVTYQLGGQYQRFESLVGFDESLARLGRARLAVQLDGKRIDLNGGKELTCRDAPLKVRLDVRNVRAMTLLVELGSFGDVQAHVNWAQARLIKGK